MLLPPPDISAAYVDDKNRPSKDLFNWLKSLYDYTRTLTRLTSGGTVTQTTSINTPVTINATSGKITTVSNAFVAGSPVFFTVNNNTVSDNDVVVVNQNITGVNGYVVSAFHVQAGAFVVIIQPFATITEAIGINFAVIKPVSS